MKTDQFIKRISSLTLAVLLTGFTGKEKFVELDGYLNGRSSASFRPMDQNIRVVLSKGTRGEILGYHKLPSGNYAIRIRALNGSQAQGVFWVYHNVKDSELKLYETAPSTWTATTRQASSVGAARAVETRQAVSARRDSAPTRPAAAPRSSITSSVRPASAPASTQSASRAVELIASANAEVRRAGESNCSNCTITPQAGVTSIIKPGTRRMAPACNNLVNSNGQLGADGQTIFNIMAEPKYASHFTANNALGQFCPKFNQLTSAQKLTAWTWFWTALASEESACNANVRHGTTYRDKSGRVRVLNPVEGHGLWAMERDRNVRRWRGAACTDISTVAGQARCSIDIMLSTQLTKGRTAGINQMSYWGPIRRGNSQIIPHMRRLSLCF